MQALAKLTKAIAATLALTAFASPSHALEALERDDAGRMLAPVTVNGAGPYRMIIDTGANRTALSERVALDLGLALEDAPTREVHGVAGAADIPMVEIAHFRAGELERRDVDALVLSGYMLSQADGVLGMDGMLGKRLVIDFEHRTFEIGPGGAPAPAGFLTVPGRLRFGHLLEIAIDVDGAPVRAIVDTGSEATIANPALLSQLGPEARFGATFVVVGANGETAPAERARLRNLRLGPLMIDSLAVHGAPLPAVRGADGKELPAIHLGMDVLSSARAIAIDLSRAELQVLLGPSRPAGLRAA